jgi:hypothetical protein
MAAGPYRITIEKGATFGPRECTWTDDAGALVNLTNYLFWLKAYQDIDDAEPVLYLSNYASLYEVAVAVGGTGYVVGEVLILAGGTGGTVTVLTVGTGGVVTSVSILADGSAYTTGVKATTGGSGTACTINVVTVTHGISINVVPTTGKFSFTWTEAETLAMDFSVLQYRLYSKAPTPSFFVTRLFQGEIELSK